MSEHEVPQPRSLRRERRLWHDSTRHSLCLGCSTCPERTICGGLSIGFPIFDCLDLCCGKPETCDNVCRSNPEFAARVREVATFALDTVPQTAGISITKLPQVVPMLFHGRGREVNIAHTAVALSLYRMFNRRDGTPRFASHEALCSAYGIAEGTSIILSGTDCDRPLERWWSYGEADRRQIIRALRNMRVTLVTTPNYSLFTDVPRWNDLHSMKRIALVHYEFLSEGVSAALHVNGRTETDFHRWTDYVSGRPEITHLAYEFTTGTRWSGRRELHAKWLCQLASAAGRPLHLVMRGGVEVLSELTSAFATTTVLETSTFLKTMMRRKASANGNTRLGWIAAPTPEGTPVDGLFAHNLRAMRAWLTEQARPASTARSA